MYEVKYHNGKKESALGEHRQGDNVTLPGLEDFREEMVKLRPKEEIESAKPSRGLPGAGMGNVTGKGNCMYKGLEGEKV